MVALDSRPRVRPALERRAPPSLQASPAPGSPAGLVVIARGKLPIPSRTRPIRPAAPMVLRLKTWESRSPPDQYAGAMRSLHVQSQTAIVLSGSTLRRAVPEASLHAARDTCR